MTDRTKLLADYAEARKHAAVLEHEVHDAFCQIAEIWKETKRQAKDDFIGGMEDKQAAELCFDEAAKVHVSRKRVQQREDLSLVPTYLAEELASCTDGRLGAGMDLDLDATSADASEALHIAVDEKAGIVEMFAQWDEYCWGSRYPESLYAAIAIDDFVSDEEACKRAQAVFAEVTADAQKRYDNAMRSREEAQRRNDDAEYNLYLKLAEKYGKNQSPC